MAVVRCTIGVKMTMETRESEMKERRVREREWVREK